MLGVFFSRENWFYKFSHWKGEWGEQCTYVTLRRKKHKNEGLGLLFAIYMLLYRHHGIGEILVKFFVMKFYCLLPEFIDVVLGKTIFLAKTRCLNSNL
jgi:hypothetical protein